MGAKKRLRRSLQTAERTLAELGRETARLGTQLANARTDRDRVHEHLAKAGFLRVDGLRTIEDRLQAARMGVIVLDDLQMLSEPQYTVESGEPTYSSLFGTLQGIPGPITESLKLEITGDRAILRALRESLAKHV